MSKIKLENKNKFRKTQEKILEEKLRKTIFGIKQTKKIVF
jgi:hypothetical protein